MYPTGNTQDAPSQTPSVSVEIQRLEKIHAELTEIVAALDSRLTAVLREPEPSNPVENVKVGPVLAPSSQLAVALRCCANDAEGLVYRLSSMLRRLDI